MIVWIASYPRSGNSFVRFVIEDVFRIPTFSIYPEEPVYYGPAGLEVANPGSPFFSANKSSPYNRNKLIETARKSPRLHFIKTLGAPIDDSSALYIERDGRAACVSFLHFLHDTGHPEITMKDVILGSSKIPLCPSWSAHYEAWKRPQTTVVRFEKIIRDVQSLITTICSKYGLVPTGRFLRDFSSLHELAPVLFRKGDNAANIAELTGEDETLFWQVHGRSMKERGFV